MARSAEIYSSVRRDPRSELIGLMKDARNNALVRYQSEAGIVHVIPPAFPSTKRQLLVIPDTPDQTQITSITETPVTLLADTFKVATDVAASYLTQRNVTQVDLMINRSNDGGGKDSQTQRPLHIHVVGYSDDDMKRPLEEADRTSRELSPKLKEPLRKLTNDLLQQAVFLHIIDRHPDFGELLRRGADERQNITFNLNHGIETIIDPRFGILLQGIQRKAEGVYDTVAACFLQQKSDGTFVDAPDGRYALLEPTERQANVETFINQHPLLSYPSQRLLQFLATSAEDLDNTIQRKTGREPKDLDPKEKTYYLHKFGAFRGPAFATTISGIKTPRGIDWRLGFDPSIFGMGGTMRASRGREKHMLRDPGRAYDPEILRQVQEYEAATVAHLLHQNDRYFS